MSNLSRITIPRKKIVKERNTLMIILCCDINVHHICVTIAPDSSLYAKPSLGLSIYLEIYHPYCLFVFLSFHPCMQSTPLSGRLFVRRFITLSLVLNANIYDQSLDSVGLVLRFVWLSGQISEKTPQSCPCNPKIGLYVCVRFRVHVV